MVWPKQGGFGVVATTTTGPNDASRCVGWALGEFFFIFFMFFLLIYVFRPTSHPFRPSAPVSTPSRPPAMLFDPSRQPRVLDPQPSVRPVTHLFRVSTTHAMRSWPIATCSRPPAMRSTPHPLVSTTTPHQAFSTHHKPFSNPPPPILHPRDMHTRVSGGFLSFFLFFFFAPRGHAYTCFWGFLSFFAPPVHAYACSIYVLKVQGGWG